MKLLPLFVLLAACTPSTSGPGSPDVVTVEAGTPDACAIAAEVCKARLIRAPDGGALCVVPPGCAR